MVLGKSESLTLAKIVQMYLDGVDVEIQSKPNTMSDEEYNIVKIIKRIQKSQAFISSIHKHNEHNYPKLIDQKMYERVKLLDAQEELIIKLRRLSDKN